MLRRFIEIVATEGFRGSIDAIVRYINYKILRSTNKILFSYGTGRVCNICGWNGSKFLRFGIEQRPDSLCPRCGSKERHRHLWEYLTSEILDSSSNRILYFAPIIGLEHNIRNLSQTRVTTTDLNQTYVDVRADICDLPFQNCAFDLIICSHVLEHIRDDFVALQEIYRVLDKDGRALILIPQDRKLEFTYEDSTISTRQQRLNSYGSPDHVRLYGRDAANKFDTVGFDVSTIDYTQKFEEGFVRTHRLQEHENWMYSTTCIFECSKSC